MQEGYVLVLTVFGRIRYWRLGRSRRDTLIRNRQQRGWHAMALWAEASAGAGEGEPALCMRGGGTECRWGTVRKIVGGLLRVGAACFGASKGVRVCWVRSLWP